MKPWSDEAYDLEQDQWDRLWDSVEPNDFYFACYEDYDGVNVAITPIEYFDREGYVSDQTPHIEHLLPDYMFEIMESLWESEKSMEETRNDLLSRGFIESEKMRQLCEVE